jgi:hippurate hydrolase
VIVQSEPEKPTSACIGSQSVLLSINNRKTDMPIINRVAEYQQDMTAWRRHIHQHPELLYDVEGTAAFIADRLQEFGVDEIVTGIGRTGVVGIIRGQSEPLSRTVGLRADMDALPIEEKTGQPYASQNPGKMHACGHDGHSTMLLGAARYLAETRNFTGSVAVIFQPAEEGGAGAKAMIDDGMMDRFDISEVYGMHNKPGLPVGEFSINDGPIMASTDEFLIHLTGRGGHAAWPHDSADPVLAASQIAVAMQSAVSRNTDPLDAAVVSITSIQAGEAFNVIPQRAAMIGTIRTLREPVRAMLHQRCKEIAEGVGAAMGVETKFELRGGYPVTRNHAEFAGICGDIAAAVSGKEDLDRHYPPSMGGEDFSFMMLERPGAFIWIGNGDSAGLHNEAYDFNDEALPVGASYWIKLAESRLPRAVT